MLSVCHVILSVHCSLVVNSKERADPLVLLYVMFYYAFVTFRVLGQVWCWIVSIFIFFFLLIITIKKYSDCLDIYIIVIPLCNIWLIYIPFHSNNE